MSGAKGYCFENSPASHEVELYNALLGKKPLEAAKIIAEEYIHRFPEAGPVETFFKEIATYDGAYPWIGQYLRSQNDYDGQIKKRDGQQYISWNDLEVLLERYHDHYFDESSTMERFWRNAPDTKPYIERRDQRSKFIDNVLHILHTLPRKRDYTPQLGKAEYPDAKSKAMGFKLCSLCWRSAPVKPLQKKTHFCYLHGSLDKNGAEYKRRKRIGESVLAQFWELRAQLIPKLVAIKGGEEKSAFCVNLVTQAESPLSLLREHVLKHCSDITDNREIARAIEAPFEPPAHLEEIESKAWDAHFDDYAEFFDLHIKQILMAEAWLRVEAARKHGGKRDRKTQARDSEA